MGVADAQHVRVWSVTFSADGKTLPVAVVTRRSRCEGNYKTEVADV
jgi:hypothetical protein